MWTLPVLEDAETNPFQLQTAELLMCEFARIAGGLMRLGHVNMNT
ncbi:hypothetical protein BFJ63_vAg881 [Fusarium oxysporum f. sp. narcissi]|uniref:Uncharacterized protein n=1 Tax=Fusarium oxysporum f. sp. narcissi TaxID=451672 RepID=A0A4Q2WDK1_FUSOX|nr:hypothetical protein BFJ63_vAg881 [Fusarium oxysporum f. sp. narcissi]